MSNGSCPSEYKCSDKGLVLPLTNESDWSDEVRACLYFLGMIYCFLGIATIADIFMCSIEKITSSTRQIRVAGEGGEVKMTEIKVWNDTVANLTLMALGSSAPEILLAIIETIGNGFEAGDLGPATIVGSAAFNLHVIIGVCISGIPDGESRYIKETGVFILTAVTSLFAYFWIYLILGPITADVVDVWEALLTLMFFPILVIASYLVDKNFCKLGRKRVGVEEDPGALTVSNGMYLTMPGVNEVGGHQKVDKQQVAEIMKLMEKDPSLTPEKAAALVAKKVNEERPHSRAYHKVAATRTITGGAKVQGKAGDEESNLNYEKLQNGDARNGSALSNGAGAGAHRKSVVELSQNNTRAVIEFTTSTVSVYEKDKRARLGVRRYGCKTSRVIVRFETLNGTAEAGSDYVARKETITFDNGEDYKYIDIDIVDDDLAEDDETFFVKLALDESCIAPPTGAEGEGGGVGGAVLGRNNVCTVIIMDDDEPGVFEFEKPSFLVKESVEVARIPVKRHSGTDGACSVSWRTIDVTAIHGVHYHGGEGKIEFAHGEAVKEVEIGVVDEKSEEKDESFQIMLLEPTGGARVGKKKTTVVTIVCDEDYASMLDKVTKLANVDLEKLNVTMQSWADQFREAMNVNGGELDEASVPDYIFHALNFFWKVLFAFVPPPKYFGGYPCFFVSLFMIGVLTMIVGDLASIFGCLIGLKDLVTAITFVALGTSLPDLFASRQAAANDKYADNAVGNVTGSNSVNVFLGLGLPWTIAAIYHAARGESFNVPAGSFSYSVVLYTGTAVFALLLIGLRRLTPFFGHAELGGHVTMKHVSACILYFLWFIYILFSALEAYNHIEGF